jgi:hypothetical protein
MYINRENHLQWFAYDWDDQIQYFETQAAAIAWVESQIPLYFDDDDREWDEDVTFLSVGFMTHAVKNFPVKDRDYCDYKLAPLDDDESDRSPNP